jgi:hypothetical protein
MEKSMKTLAAVGLFAGLTILAGGAFAEDTPAPPKEKKLCRSLEVTGSIMPKHSCHTKAEWAQIDAANAADARQFADRPHSSIDGH